MQTDTPLILQSFVDDQRRLGLDGDADVDSEVLDAIEDAIRPKDLTITFGEGSEAQYSILQPIADAEYVIEVNGFTCMAKAADDEHLHVVPYLNGKTIGIPVAIAIEDINTLEIV